MLDHFKVNALANVHLINIFMPLILNGQHKKVIAISSGMADLDTTRDYDIEFNGPYSISKAALNAVIAIFSAEYKKDGVLFLAVAPGMVDTGVQAESTNIEVSCVGLGLTTPLVTEESMPKMMAMGAKFSKYAPHFKGPDPVTLAVARVISVFEKASIEKGDGGAFVSQFGNKTWL